MDIYRNLNWSRKTFRSPDQQLQFFSFNLSDNEDDVFYQNLNEVDSVFVNETDRLKTKCSYDSQAEENSEDDKMIMDPRTNKLVEQLIHDHTQPNITTNRVEIKYFDKFPRNSTILKKNHLICMRAINLLCSINRELTEEDKIDLQIYQSLENFRIEEKKQFQLFVQNHFSAFLVSRFSKVDEQFKIFLLKYEQYKIDEWRKLCGQKSYILQTSIPNKAVTINDTVDLKFVKIMHKTGIVPLKLTKNKLNYINCAKNSKFNLIYLDPKSIKFKPIELDPNVNRIVSELEGTVNFVVHFSSLIYLIDNSLKSWNIQVNIQKMGNDNCIFIEKCLPRNDLSTIDMIKRGLKCALKCDTLNYNNKASWNLDEDRVCGTEIKTNNLSAPSWNPETFEDYLKNLKYNANVFKPNNVYSLWNLTDEKLKFNSNILIRSKYDAREHQETKLINLSTKIEFQSEFGAEIMTKTELIKEWLKQYVNVDSVTKRIRIDSQTGTILSQKYLNLIQIENDLKRLYNLEPKTLLNNLTSKLDLISKNFPSGEYLLQYNADSFQHVKIYKLHMTSTNVTEVKLLSIDEYLAGINLYNLDNAFVQYPSPNQIDDMEITLVHRHARTMPCTFLYADNVNQQTSNKPKNKLTKQKPFVLVDEKKRFNQKRQEIQKRQLAQRNTKKNRKKKLRREKKAENVRLLNESKEREAREQRQFEYEYNIHGMFDEYGNVRTVPFPTNETLPSLNLLQNYTYEASPKRVRKLNTTPQSTPPHLPITQDINKTNYSILTTTSSSSTLYSLPLFSAASSSVESGDNDLKIETIKNNNSNKSNTDSNNKRVAKPSSGKSVLGSLRKSMRLKVINNKSRYF